MSANLVLVALDTSPLAPPGLAEELVASAGRLARALGLRVGLFTAVPPVLTPGMDVPSVDSGALLERLRLESLAAARAAQDTLAAAPTLAGLQLEREVVDGDPGESILARAEQPDVAFVVMGTHGRRGLARLLLGSVAQRVLTRSPRPVLVCRAGVTLPASAGLTEQVA